MQISKIACKEINLIRTDYLRSLPESQELFLEMLVQEADYYSIEKDHRAIGYVVQSKGHRLVEFYLYEQYLPDCMIYFKAIIQELSIVSIYCKSFDHLLLNCCLESSYGYQLIGHLFRNRLPMEIRPFDNLTTRPANESDVPFLLEQEDGLYETPEELACFVKNGNVSLFYQQQQLVGCGYLTQVHPSCNYYDVGMWVHPVHRKQGIASQIIANLSTVCSQNGWNAIAGCAFDNIASKKTLEKNGFITKYKLIEFSV